MADEDWKKRAGIDEFPDLKEFDDDEECEHDR